MRAFFLSWGIYHGIWENVQEKSNKRVNAEISAQDAEVACIISRYKALAYNSHTLFKCINAELTKGQLNAELRMELCLMKLLKNAKDAGNR